MGMEQETDKVDQKEQRMTSWKDTYAHPTSAEK
jgi:hypothetical protein